MRAKPTSLTFNAATAAQQARYRRANNKAKRKRAENGPLFLVLAILRFGNV